MKVQPKLDNQLASIIADKVAKKYDVRVEIMRSNLRIGDVNNARQITMYIMREQGWSYAEIGMWFNRNHATVLHSVRKIQNYIDIYKVFRNEMRMLLCDNQFQTRLYIAGKVRGLPYMMCGANFKTPKMFCYLWGIIL